MSFDPTPVFLDLARMPDDQLETLLRESPAPALDDLIGWDFGGWNKNPFTEILGTRKFGKGFFGPTGWPTCWGYNIQAHHGGVEEPWRFRTDADGDPRRWYYFGAEEAGADDSEYPNAVVVDYREWEAYHPLNPAGYTVDYLVSPDSSDKDVLLGKAYAKLEPVESFLGWFFLQRVAANDNPGGAFNETHERILEAFVSAWYDGAGDAVPGEIVRNLSRQLTGIDPGALARVHTGLILLETLIAPGFSRRSLEDRRLVLRRFQDPDHDGIADLYRRVGALRTLAAVGHYQDERVQRAIGYQRPDTRRAIERKGVALELEPTPTGRARADVCVIGSGPGGAVAAKELAERGLSVILVEAGPYLPPDRVGHDEAAMLSTLYVNHGLQSNRSGSMAILQASCLGGSSFVNNCICFRMHERGVTHPDAPDILSEWRRTTGVDIDDDELNVSYQAVEDFLRPVPLDDDQVGPNGRVLIDGWEAIRADNDPSPYGPFSKNYFTEDRRCASCGYCNSACAYGRKNSMTESYIATGLAASRNGSFRVFANCEAMTIEKGARGMATAVLCRTLRGDLRIESTHVVVAAGVIASSRLLKRSRIGTRVGRNISFNAGTAMVARHRQEVRAWDGVQMATYIDRGEFLLESLFHPPMGLSAILAGWGTEHTRRMLALNQLSCAGILIRTPADGRLRSGGVDFKWEREQLDVLKDALLLLGRIQFQQGAEEVFPPTVVGIPARSVDELRTILDRHIGDQWDLTLSSAHPQGGNIMSATGSKGVVDDRMRVFGVGNVYVCDASVFPTPVRVNPQLTIMALAHRFATRFGA